MKKERNPPVKPTILDVKEDKSVEVIKRMHEEDPFKARIYALSKSGYVSSEVALFVDSDDKFSIQTNEYKQGVSVTGKLYTRKKKSRVVVVNKGKFHLIYFRGIKALQIFELTKVEYTAMVEKYPWVRMLKENHIHIPLNTVYKHKLFNLRKCLRYMYKCKPEPAKAIHEMVKMDFSYYKMWREASKWVTNLDNLNPELISKRNFFFDATNMGMRVNQKVNASWSVRRLKEEHDKWAKIITNVMFEADNRELNIAPVFIELSNHLPGLLRTTKELAIEGMVQSHCVASYGDRVDYGGLAIFHIDGYTAEIRVFDNKLIIGQFKGFQNQNAPLELFNQVQATLDSFNSIHYPIHQSRIEKVQIQEYDLPFADF